VNEMNEEEKKANCFAFEWDENGFPLKGKSVARSGIPLSTHFRNSTLGKKEGRREALMCGRNTDKSKFKKGFSNSVGLKKESSIFDFNV
jgi:hypothetical protein